MLTVFEIRKKISLFRVANMRVSASYGPQTHHVHNKTHRKRSSVRESIHPSSSLDAYSHQGNLYKHVELLLQTEHRSITQHLVVIINLFICLVFISDADWRFVIQKLSPPQIFLCAFFGFYFLKRIIFIILDIH